MSVPSVEGSSSSVNSAGRACAVVGTATNQGAIVVAYPKKTPVVPVDLALDKMCIRDVPGPGRLQFQFRRGTITWLLGASCEMPLGGVW